MRSLLLLLVLSLILTACASAAGTGEDPTPSDDAPIPVEPDGGIGDSSNPASETPIPVEPDGGIGDGAGPPSPSQAPGTAASTFGVSSETDSAAVPAFTGCPDDGNGAGICADVFPTPSTRLRAADQLVITYDVGELIVESSEDFEGGPDQSELPERTTVPSTIQDPGIWLVDVSGLEPGDHAIWLTWTRNDVTSTAVITVSIAR
ncbi:MAG: hypothetical protein ACR2HR_16420 [Euzebya sp.]